MSFGGGGSQGTIRYALVVDDAQATQKLNTFKTSLTQLATPTANINKNLAQMGTTLKTNSATITQSTTQINAQTAAQQKLATVTATTGKNVATMGTQFQATTNKIKSAGPPLANLEKTSTSLTSSLKNNVSKFSGLATGLSATASGALQLAAGFRDYNDAQIAVDRVTRRLSLGQEALGKAQAKLNTLQKSGKASSAELAQAQLDVTQAQKQVEIQTQLVGEAQERMFDAQSQFAVSVIPTVLGAVGTLGSAFKAFGGEGGILSKVTESFSKLKGAGGIGGMAGILGPLGLAVAAVAGSFLLWKDATDKTQETMEKVRQAGAIEDVTERVKAMNTELDKLKQPFSSPALNTIFNIGPGKLILEKTVEKAKELNKTKQENSTVSGLLKTKLDELTKAEQKYNHALETRQTTDDAAAKAAFEDAKAQYEKLKAVEAANVGTDKLTDAVALYNKGLTVATDTTKTVTVTTTNLNRALDYQLGLLPGVNSAADEYAMGVDEIDEKTVNAVASVNLQNRALDYQLGLLPGVNSAADEYAMGVDELGEKTSVAAASTAILNRALDYQLGRLPGVESAADEYAMGVDEIDEKAINAAKSAADFNRALDYQRGSLPGVASAADEVAKGIDEVGTSSEEAKKTTAELIVELGHATPLFDSMREAAKGLQESFAKFAESSRIDIADKLGLKGVAEKVDKLVDKITDDLPKKIGDIKLKPELKMEIDKKSIEQAAGIVVSGLSEEIESSDEAADAVAKSIKKNLPKGDAGDAMREFLDKAIEASNTGELLTDNLEQDLEGGGYILKIPAEPDFGTGGGFPGAGFAGELWGDKPAVKIPAEIDKATPTSDIKPIEMEAKITRVYAELPDPKNPFYDPSKHPDKKGLEFDPTFGKDGDGQKPMLDLSSMETNAKAVFTNIKKQFNLMIGTFTTGSSAWQSQWSADMNTMAKNTAAGGKKSTKEFVKMIGTFTTASSAFASQWSSDMNTMVKNTKSGGKGVNKEFDKMIGKMASASAAMASQWSSDMNSMIKNAKSAASGVNKALAGIKDQTVTIKVGITGAGASFIGGGGTIRLAGGGIISAAKGYTTTGPQLMVVGDNPGGRETIAVIPHNEPSRSNTMNLLENQFGKQGGAAAGGRSGDIVINLTNVLSDKEITRTFRRELGKDIYRFGPT